MRPEMFLVECAESGESMEIALRDIPEFIKKNRQGNTEWTITADYTLNEVLE